MVDASLVVSFDSESHSNDGISLELHRGFAGLRTGIPFRVYPQVEARLICEFGQISTGQQRFSEENELVVFTGSATASLKRPVATGVVLEVVNVSFDESGNVANPAVYFDQVQQTVVADRGLIQFWFERIAKPTFLPSQSDHEADWYAAFQSFNWGEILEELNVDFPHIKEAR